MIRLKRVYDPPSPEDGFRILVERLWPRGLKKEDARVDLWLKEIAPSPELRKWFAHDVKRWGEFQERYSRELESNPDALRLLRDEIRARKNVTLVYAARDTDHNSAFVLKHFLAAKPRGVSVPP